MDFTFFLFVFSASPVEMEDLLTVRPLPARPLPSMLVLELYRAEAALSLEDIHARLALWGQMFALGVPASPPPAPADPSAPAQSAAPAVSSSSAPSAPSAAASSPSVLDLQCVIKLDAGLSPDMEVLNEQVCVSVCFCLSVFDGESEREMTACLVLD